MREKKSLSKLPFEGSILFHLAGEIEKKSLLFDTNVMGTKKHNGFGTQGKIKHFIYLSSAGVIGYQGKDQIGEDVSCRPRVNMNRANTKGKRCSRSILKI